MHPHLWILSTFWQKPHNCVYYEICKYVFWEFILQVLDHLRSTCYEIAHVRLSSLALLFTGYVYYCVWTNKASWKKCEGNRFTTYNYCCKSHNRNSIRAGVAPQVQWNCAQLAFFSTGCLKNVKCTYTCTGRRFVNQNGWIFFTFFKDPLFMPDSWKVLHTYFCTILIPVLYSVSCWN